MDKSAIGLWRGALSSIAGQVALIPAGLSFGALAAGSLLALSAADAKVYAGFVLGILVLGGLAWIARKADRNLVRGLLLLYVLVIAAWALTKVSQQISDFGVYLRCGAPGWDEADSFRQWMRQCQSAWLPGNPTYWRRSLLYTLPIGMLGGEYLALRLVNAGLHIAAIVGLYQVVARSTSRQQGILAAAALAIVPEYWFTTSLATSDNLVVPLLVLWLGLVASSTSDEMPAWKVVAAAIIGVALDLLRDIGLVCVLTTLILAMLTPSRGRWRFLSLSVLTFGLMVVAGRLGANLMQASAESAGLLARLTGHGITSSSAWADNYRWNQYVYPLLDPQTRSRYFVGLLTMDLQHGVLAAFQNWATKIQVLFQGDGYYYFSAAPLDGNPDNFPIGNASPASLPNVGVGFVLKGLTAAIAFFAIIGGARSRSQALGNASIVFNCAFLFLVIGFGEIQPRYAALLAPALCIMIAGLLAPASQSTAGTAADICKGIACFAGAVAIMLFALTAMLGKSLAPAPSLTGFRQEDGRTIEGTPCNATIARVSMQERFARIEFPSGQPSCYSFILQAAGGEQPLALHVIRDPILPRWKTPSATPVTVSVSNEGTPDGPDLASASLRTEVARQLRVPAISKGTKLRITIHVYGNLDESMQGVVIGFVQAASGQPARLLSSNE